MRVGPVILFQEPVLAVYYRIVRQYLDKLWADNRFNRGLLVSMIVIKVLICIIIVMGIIIRLFNVALGSGLILSFLIIVVIYFSKRIRKRSLSMEKQFLENFQGTAGTFPQEEPETGETSTEKNHELSNK